MRKIFLITERRADYSRFKPILDIIKNDPELEYDLVVTGMHLKEEHGMTINEIIKDGFEMWDTDVQDGRQRIADGALVPILVKAIQELSAKNTELEARITTLEG